MQPPIEARSPYFDPLVEQLESLIKQNHLEKDELNQARAEILQYIFNSRKIEDSENSGQEELLVQLEKLMFQVVQPAFLFNQSLQPKQSEKSIDAERSLVDLQQALKNLMDQLSDKYVFLKNKMLLIHSLYQRALLEWRSAPPDKKKSLLIPRPEIIGTSLDFYYMDWTTGLTLLCSDQYDFPVRTIGDGTHRVAAWKKVHWKPNAFGIYGLNPAGEYTAFSFYTMFATAKVVAPTTLLKISNVYVQRILKAQQTDHQAFQEFERKRNTGVAAKVILEDKSLDEKLIKVPGVIENVVQAGETINGFGLDQILCLIEEYAWLKTLSPELLKTLESVLSKDYVSDFLRANPCLNNNMKKEDVYNFFLSVMRGRRLEDRFQDFQKEGSNETGHISNKNIINRYPTEYVIAALAFITKWPKATQNRELCEIVNLIKVFDKVDELLPDTTPVEKDEELSNLLDKFDRYYLNVHYVGSLITGANDGRPDNYMVVVEREQRRIKSLKVTGIDMDEAFYPLVMLRGEKRYPGVKSVILGFPLAGERLNGRFRQELLSRTPEAFTFHWLEALYKQNQRYQRLENLGVITNKDRFDPQTNDPVLDTPMRMDPNALKRFFQDYQRVYQLVAENPDLTLHQLFAGLNPALARYYAILMDKFAKPFQPMKLIHAICRGDSIEDVLSGELDAVAENGKSYKENLEEFTEGNPERNQELEDAIQTQFIAQLDYTNKNQDLLPRLIMIAKKFPFVSRLPLTPEQLNNLLHHAVENSLVELVALLLRAGADVNHKNKEGRTSLHIAVGLVKPFFPIVKLLLTSKNIKPNELDKLRNPAFFYCFRDSRLVGLLMKHGCELEMSFREVVIQEETKTIKKKATLLDYTIESGLTKETVALINLGIGKKVNARHAYRFLKTQLEDPKVAPPIKAELQAALTKLSKQNTKVAFLGSLDSIFQPDRGFNSLGKVRVVGMYSGARVLNDAVKNQIYTSDGEFIKSNEFGRHKVPLVNYGGFKTRLKYRGEDPMKEIATRKLALALWNESDESDELSDSGDSLTPENEIYCFPGQDGKPVPVLVSNHIEGHLLTKVFANADLYKKLQTKLSMFEYTKIYILMLLALPADCKPDQIIFEPFINSKGEEDYRLKIVDNEQGFLKEPVVRTKEGRKLQAKVTPFCFDHTKQQLDRRARQIFLNKNMKKVLETWLIEVAEDQKRLDNIFTDQDRTRLNDSDDSVILKMTFAQGAVAVMLERALFIQEKWRDHPDITGSAMLRLVLPPLLPYVINLGKDLNPAGRYKKLFEEQYSVVVTNDTEYKFITQIPAKAYLRTQNIPAEAVLAAESDYSPTHALAELRRVSNELDKKDEIVNQLKQGNLSGFNNLILNSSKEKVLAATKIGQLPRDIQLLILKALADVSIVHLDLSAEYELCLMTDGILPQRGKLYVKKKGNGLEYLVLNSSGVEVRDIITKDQLEHEITEPYTLDSLKPLLYDILKITAKREHTIASSVNNVVDNDLLLEALEGSPNLHELDISGCTKLTPKVIPLLAEKCPLLKRLYMRSAQLQHLCQKREEGGIRLLPKVFSSSKDNTNIKRSDPIYFPSLEVLEVSGSPVETIELKAPELKILLMDDCPKLTLIFVEGNALEKVSHNGLSVLPAAQLEKLAGQSTGLLKNPSLMTTNVTIDQRFVARCRGEYRNAQLWNDKVFATLTVTDQSKLDLAGLSLNRDELTKAVGYCRQYKIREVNLHGSMISLFQFLAVIKELAGNGQLVLTDYRKKIVAAPIRQERNLRTFVVGLRGEIFFCNFEKDFFRAATEYEKDHDHIKIAKIDSFIGHETSVTKFVVLPEGDIVTGSHDRTVRVWNTLTQECIAQFSGHAGKITCLVVMNRIVISAAEDNFIRHWDLQTGECIKHISLGKESIKAVEALSSTVYVTGSSYNNLCFRTISGEILKTLVVNSAINDIKKVGQELVATAHNDGSIRIWNFNTYSLVKTLKCHSLAVTTLQSLQHESTFASGSDDKTIIVWDLDSGQSLNVLKGHTSAISTLGRLPDGSLLSSCHAGNILHWPLASLAVDLSGLDNIEHPVSITTGKNSLILATDPSAKKVLQLCQQLFSYALGPEVNITLTDKTLKAEFKPEYRQRLLELYTAIKPRLPQAVALAWNASKPSATPEKIMLGRNSSSGQPNFFRGSNSGIIKETPPTPTSPLPVHTQTGSWKSGAKERRNGSGYGSPVTANARVIGSVSPKPVHLSIDSVGSRVSINGDEDENSLSSSLKR